MILDEPATDSQLWQGLACTNCGHLKEIHDPDKCFALTFNGSIYDGCNCRRFSSEIKIKVSIPEISVPTVESAELNEHK